MEKPLGLLRRFDNAHNVIIYSSPFVIGRSRTARLIITDVNISRNHCQLIHSKNQVWILQDLSSSGTYLDDELVGKDNSVIVKNNQIIRLGPKNCNFIWQFITDLERVPLSGVKCNIMNIQSQAIVDICNEKDTLQRQIILNREAYLKMKLEKEKLSQQCLSQFQAIENRFLSSNNQLENNFEMQNNIEKKVEEEKSEINLNLEKELISLQEKIAENNKKEEELKAEVQKLQEKLILEHVEWENRFLEEKKMLEEKISEQNEKLIIEKVKAEELSMAHKQEFEEKLKKEEEEKRILLEKLQEMEEAKHILSQKLKASDELYLLEKALFEEKMQQELLKCEKNTIALMQQQADTLNEPTQSANNPKEGEENIKSEDLLKELDHVKNTLIETESKQKLLEKELAEVNSLKDQASRVKSTVLENIADLMESELQCGICSELFVTAITLNCTHTFCKYCIDTWKKKKKNCPICRKSIASENRSIVMDNYIDKMVENLPDEFKSRRKAIIAERKCDIPCKKSNSSCLPSESTDNTQPVISSRRGGNRVGSNRAQNRRQVSRVSGSSR